MPSGADPQQARVTTARLGRLHPVQALPAVCSPLWPRWFARCGLSPATCRGQRKAARTSRCRSGRGAGVLHKPLPSSCSSSSSCPRPRGERCNWPGPLPKKNNSLEALGAARRISAPCRASSPALLLRAAAASLPPAAAGPLRCEPRRRLPGLRASRAQGGATVEPAVPASKLRSCQRRCGPRRLRYTSSERRAPERGLTTATSNSKK